MTIIMVITSICNGNNNNSKGNKDISVNSLLKRVLTLSIIFDLSSVCMLPEKHAFIPIIIEYDDNKKKKKKFFFCIAYLCLK